MKITYKQIMSLDPCYDPMTIGMPEDYEAELKDFVIEYKDKVKSLKDIIWVCCRNEFFNDRDLRLFGVWCALQIKHLITDQRSLDSLEIAERFAFGLATQEELNDAYYTASASAEAAWDAAWAATDAAYASAAAYAYAADAASAASAASASAASAASAYASAYAAAYAAAASTASTASAASTADAASEVQIQTILTMIDKPNGEWFKEWRRQQ